MQNSSGEKDHGLEVFLQKGLYGVMRNGKVTCPARFKRVERLQKGCGFFALGVYVQLAERRHAHSRPPTSRTAKSSHWVGFLSD